MADQGQEGLLSPLLRVRRIRAAIPWLEGRVLDVGCGGGGLAEFVSPSNYVGVEIDEISRGVAKSSFPNHLFCSEMPNSSEKFDAVVALAVIEHVDDPELFIEQLASHLNSMKNSRIVITTPHPTVEKLHLLGAKLGLFSAHANEEHGDLISKSRIQKMAALHSLQLVYYGRFMVGANQLAVFAAR